MNPLASLNDLVESLDFPTEEYRSYFDRQTGRIVSVDKSLLSAWEDGDEEALEDVPAWQKDEVKIARAIMEDNTGRFIDPPDKFDFNEYSQMEEFIDTIRDERIANQLARAIRGSGAFRRFKETLYDLGIQDQWFEYRAQAMKEFVIEWAEENELAYEDDFKIPKTSKAKTSPQAASAQTLASVTLLVRDYDEALRYFTNALRFKVLEDTVLDENKRWVVVAPAGSQGAGILLAKASTPEQNARVGSQAGERVFLILNTDDFWRDYKAMQKRGVKFTGEPRKETYGTVAVFQDLYGNKWDLLQTK